jgi:hypothetical protein
VRIYISCHAPGPANELAAALTASGHEVVSTWHSSGYPRPANDDAQGWQYNANLNCEQIETADALVVVASADHISRVKCVPGGKFFEAGYAHALRNEDGEAMCSVFTLGGVENGMLYTFGVTQAKDTAELLDLLASLGSR